MERIFVIGSLRESFDILKGMGVIWQGVGSMGYPLYSVAQRGLGEENDVSSLWP